jgi:hypothetical protein
VRAVTASLRGASPLLPTPTAPPATETPPPTAPLDGSNQRGSQSPPRAATNVFGLIVIGLAVFSLANAYAQDIGRKGAVAIDQDPSGLAVVTIFSGAPLDLSGTNVAHLRQRQVVPSRLPGRS